MPSAEQPASRPETFSQPLPPAPASPMATVPVPPTTNLQSPPVPIPVPAQTLPVAPLAADDSDLIEKEWVSKAKQIVAATRDDPHLQNREMSRFKADYLKKRYNKDIKVEE